LRISIKQSTIPPISIKQPTTHYIKKLHAKKPPQKHDMAIQVLDWDRHKTIFI
jgi:fructose-1,6-bisphosphatase/sedoheptulose 1,7-bisphosphatase-like protein